MFDSDRDGLVSKSELKEALWSLGQHPGEEDIDAMFYEYDFNRSQALDCSEFRRLIVAKLSYKVQGSRSSMDHWRCAQAYSYKIVVLL